MTTRNVRIAFVRLAVLLTVVVSSMLVVVPARAGRAAAMVTTSSLDAASYFMEAEAMTLVGYAEKISDPAASGGAAIKTWKNGDGVEGSATFGTAGAYTFTIGSREDYYAGTDGAHAQLSLYLDGSAVPVGGFYATNTSGYPNYTVSVPVSAGVHSFQILFTNDAYGGTSETDRNAYIDDVTIASAAPTSGPPNPTPTVAPGVTPTPTEGSGSPIKTVFMIVLENANWSNVKGNPSAPYINNTLLPQAAHAERYYNPAGVHPSLPNYLWLEAGTNFGISNDNGPDSNHQGTTSHLTTLLNNHGISWKSYNENISGASCPLSDSYPYAVRHNPFVYFDDVTNNPAYCIAHVRPYGELSTDLQNNTVARYNFIMPNVCNDGHDSCDPLNDPLAQADTWLSQQVPQILDSPAYQNGGALFITWDEGTWDKGVGSDGPIGMIVLSPDAKHGYANSIYYTHSSTLRTLEEIFGVGPLLGGAANATDLSDLFTTL